MSKIEVDKIDPQSGTALEIGSSGDTATIPSGATLTIASGATLTNNGTATGFPEYDDDVLQSNVAMLGFKVAVNGSLTRYNLVDQAIDEFYDTSGVDASASTNDARVASGSNYYYWGASATNPTGADSTDTSVSGFTTLVCSSATGSIVIPSAANVTMLVVAGGGAGGSDYAGGGGAGGLIYKATHAVTAQTYDWVRGAGGASSGTAGDGGAGADSTWTINGGATEFTAKGGGPGGWESSTSPSSSRNGGSGGGAAYSSTTGGAETQTGQPGDSGTYGFGNAGGNAMTPISPTYNPGGGGGAGSAGAAGTAPSGGNGGTGKDYSAIFGTAVGDSGWFASGGGGGEASSGTKGTASAGGGSDGTTGGGASDAGQANTGGGSGGCGGNGAAGSGIGGSGVILVRYANDAFEAAADLTLQSTDVTALSAPTYGEFVTLIENAHGTATLNTDIKGYISRDSGVTFTQGTLVDEGTWGTNKKVLGFHDLDISGQPSGTSMCYKITTHNQVASSKETRIYATSIGWR